VSAAGSLEYAQARLWARNGRRPDEALWHRLEAVRAFPALLDTARGLPAFRDWVAGIAPTADAHAIEAVLRDHWRRLAAEVTRWMPEPWQPATAWCATVADIPVLQYLARGGPERDWIVGDPAYRNLHAGAIAAAPDLAWLMPLAHAWRQPDTMAAAWHAELMRRVPRTPFAEDNTLHDVELAFAAHFRSYAVATLRDGRPMRRALEARLRALFRRALVEPAAAFIFLALSALDVERLRGELLRRAAFPRLRLAS
jgi:hypothetical protein